MLLPSVAIEHGWDSETFLRQVCRKAGLPSSAWSDDKTQLWTFESIEFGAGFDPAVPAEPDPRGLVLAPEHLRELARHAWANVAALARGMAPSYYLPGLPDGNVAGLVLTVKPTSTAGAEPIHLAELSLRPGLPLQATLLRLCEQAARFVQDQLQASGSAIDTISVGISVLNDPALHGSLAAPDLRGFDPGQHVLVAFENDRAGWLFEPARPGDEVLTDLRGAVEGLNPEAMMLVALEARTTEPRLRIPAAPRPVLEEGPRPPAVAGRFYPADPAELDRLVDSLLAATPRQPERWASAMVPHAGLAYSGQVAASVFNRLKLPGSVLILGPKHTRDGVSWSVSPCSAWSIPGATLRSDPVLARSLAGSIPGLQLDAAAHGREHAIEVELPFLARLAPTTRVVGLAIGGGDRAHCQRFASGLAEVLRRLPEQDRPLLLISSDMNHYATDAENRRLDALALDAIERLDPDQLLKVVAAHQISMCGVLPAFIVMETLRRLGGLKRCERVELRHQRRCHGRRFPSCWLCRCAARLTEAAAQAQPSFPPVSSSVDS